MPEPELGENSAPYYAAQDLSRRFKSRHTVSSYMDLQDVLFIVLVVLVVLDLIDRDSGGGRRGRVPVKQSGL